MDKILLFYVCINLWGSQNISNNDEDIRIYVYGTKKGDIDFEGDENYLLLTFKQNICRFQHL